MKAIYVGDSGDVIKRIKINHCSNSNVEASALRLHIAEYRKYPLIKTRRPSGSRRVRIDLPAARTVEQEITTYIKSGVWQYVLCESREQANDFQWFVIEKLNPVLNIQRKSWNPQYLSRYTGLLESLASTKKLRCAEIVNSSSGPGVYVLYHESLP